MNLYPDVLLFYLQGVFLYITKESIPKWHSSMKRCSEGTAPLHAGMPLRNAFLCYINRIQPSYSAEHQSFFSKTKRLAFSQSYPNTTKAGPSTARKKSMSYIVESQAQIPRPFLRCASVLQITESPCREAINKTRFSSNYYLGK